MRRSTRLGAPCPAVDKTGKQRPVDFETGKQRPVDAETGKQRPVDAETGKQRPVDAETGKQRRAEAPQSPRPAKRAKKSARVAEVADDKDEPPRGAVDVAADAHVAHAHVKVEERDAHVAAPAGREDAKCRFKHAIFVIHGIGEQINTKPSLWENVEKLERSARELVDAHIISGMDNMDVHFIPIEWHSSVRERDNARKMSLITLKTVPWLRRLNNDWLGDILYYLCDGEKILRDVVAKINKGRTDFLRDNPGFAGSFSVLAHSLGGIISYDMLTGTIPPESPHATAGDGQPAVRMRRPLPVSGLERSADVTTLADVTAPADVTGSADVAVSADGAPSEKKGRGAKRGKATTRAHSAQSHTDAAVPDALQAGGEFGLDFTPSHFFIMGSPLAGLLVFRDKEFAPIPGCRLHNMFHPYDPLGYRLEPLINPEYADVPAVVLPHWNGGKRLHLLIRETYAARLQTLIPSVSALSTSIMALPASLQVPAFPKLEMPRLDFPKIEMPRIEMPRIDISALSPADARRRLSTFFVESMAHLGEYLPPVQDTVATMASATAQYSTEHIAEHVNEARRSLKRKFSEFVEMFAGSTSPTPPSADADVGADARPQKRRKTSRGGDGIAQGKRVTKGKGPQRRLRRRSSVRGTADGEGDAHASEPASDWSEEPGDMGAVSDAAHRRKRKRGSSCPPELELGATLQPNALSSVGAMSAQTATAVGYAEASAGTASGLAVVTEANPREEAGVDCAANGEGAKDVDLDAESPSLRRVHEHLLASPEDGQRARGGVVPPLNGLPRMDFSLQEHPLEIGSEYLFSIGSHASYWASKDVVLYVLATVRGIDADKIHNA